MKYLDEIPHLVKYLKGELSRDGASELERRMAYKADLRDEKEFVEALRESIDILEDRKILQRYFERVKRRRRFFRCTFATLPLLLFFAFFSVKIKIALNNISSKLNTPIIASETLHSNEPDNSPFLLNYNIDNQFSIDIDSIQKMDNIREVDSISRIKQLNYAGIKSEFKNDLNLTEPSYQINNDTDKKYEQTKNKKVNKTLSTSLNGATAIIIPFYKQGENKISIIEEDPCFRKVETKLIEAGLKKFDFQFIDYLALVRKIGRDQLRNLDSESDLIKKLIQESDPDIYVVADIENYSGRSSNSGITEYAYRINMSAYQSNTGRVIAATILDSGRRYYDDCQGLIDKAFQNKDGNDTKKIEIFLQQLTFCKVSSLSIEFILDSNSGFKYTDKLNNGKILAIEINNWIKENSANKKANPDGISSNYISYREILIPKKENSDFEYTVQEYGFDLLLHLNELSFPDKEGDWDFDFDLSGNTITFKLK
jgi:hypothetical protein